MAKIDPNEPCPCKSGALFKNCHGLKIKVPVTPNIDKHIPLKIIPEPDPNTRAVISKGGEDSIFFIGYQVGVAFVCGNCSAYLAIGIPKLPIPNVVLQCNKCGKFNES